MIKMIAEKLRTMSWKDEDKFIRELLHTFSESGWSLGEVENAAGKISYIGEKLQKEIKLNSKRIDNSKRFEFKDDATASQSI